MHKCGEAVAHLAVAATKLNAEVPNDTCAIEFIQQRVSLFGKNIEIGHGRPHSEGEHFLHSWVGKARDGVGRYRHSYWRGIENALKTFPLGHQGPLSFL